MANDNRRSTKEYKINPSDSINIKSKYGTLDKNNPDILYIRSKATITPTISKKDFSDGILRIKKSFEDNVRKTIVSSTTFEDKYICTIEISENGIAYGKKSHVKYDVYVKPKVQRDLSEYNGEMSGLARIFNRMLSELLADNDIEIR